MTKQSSPDHKLDLAAVQQKLRDLLDVAYQRAVQLAGHYGEVESRAATRAKAAVATFADRAKTAIERGSKLSADARNRGLELARRARSIETPSA